MIRSFTSKGTARVTNKRERERDDDDDTQLDLIKIPSVKVTFACDLLVCLYNLINSGVLWS